MKKENGKIQVPSHHLATQLDYLPFLFSPWFFGRRFPRHHDPHPKIWWELVLSSRGGEGGAELHVANCLILQALPRIRGVVGSRRGIRFSLVCHIYYILVTATASRRRRRRRTIGLRDTCTAHMCISSFWRKTDGLCRGLHFLSVSPFSFLLLPRKKKEKIQSSLFLSLCFSSSTCQQRRTTTKCRRASIIKDNCNCWKSPEMAPVALSIYPTLLSCRRSWPRDNFPKTIRRWRKYKESVFFLFLMMILPITTKQVSQGRNWYVRTCFILDSKSRLIAVTADDYMRVS